MKQYTVTHWATNANSRTKRIFYARHHAEQYARALALNGTPFIITKPFINLLETR